MPQALEHKVEHTVRRHGMIRAGDRVIAAVSGGADSVVLLHALHGLRGKLDMELGAAHLDHGLRGGEGREDAAFVTDYAASLDLPCVSEQTDVAAYCRENGCSVEQGAREVRYDFLRRVLLDQDADSVATGHTADDQAETVLMRLLRGSGSSGLSAIRPVRDGWIIRPLLDVTAGEIAEYARMHGLSYRTDRTNEDQDVLRNRIRHHLVPLLQREYNPHIVQGLARLADVTRGEAEYLDAKATTFLADHARHEDGKILRLDLDAWENAAPAVQRVLVRRLVRTLGGNEERLRFDQVEDARAWIGRGPVGRIHELPCGIRMECRRSELVLCRGVLTPFRLNLAVPGRVEVPGTNLSIHVAEGVRGNRARRDGASGRFRCGGRAPAVDRAFPRTGRPHVALRPGGTQVPEEAVQRMGRAPAVARPRAGRHGRNADPLGGGLPAEQRGPGHREDPARDGRRAYGERSEVMRILLTEEQIAEKVRSLGAQLSADYREKNPVLVGCLKGCVVFLADLMREITVPHAIDFVRTSSYGKGQVSDGVEEADIFDVNIRGRHAVIVEDIVDTGLTLGYLTEALTKQEPLSLKVCALLVKPGAHRAPVAVDYRGFDIPGDFVVGYGLDWGERYRDLPYVAVVDEQDT